MKATSPQIQAIIGRPFRLSNLESIVEKESAEASSWPALIHKALRPTMFFIMHIPAQGERVFYNISKENWCGLYALFAGKDLEFYRFRNLFRSLVCEAPIETEKDGILIFSTRKNWYKIAIIILVTIRISWILLKGLPWGESLGIK